MDNPSEVGADLISVAVGALSNYGKPCLVADLGTASKIILVDENGNFAGGIVMPGIMISAKALFANAAQLSEISLEVPEKVIGKNTIDCMKSGVLYSNAGALDGIIERMEEELGQKVTVVATGGLAKKVVPLCKKEIILDEDLLLKGLLVIYQKNN